MKHLAVAILLLTTAAQAANQPPLGTWALAPKWCKLLANGKLDEMDNATSRPSGVFTISTMDKVEAEDTWRWEGGPTPNCTTDSPCMSMEWNFAAQSCVVEKPFVWGNEFSFPALCEWRASGIHKATFKGKVTGDKLHLDFSPKDLPEQMWGLSHTYVRCEE
jgi:hypothetical protein